MDPDFSAFFITIWRVQVFDLKKYRSSKTHFINCLTCCSSPNTKLIAKTCNRFSLKFLKIENVLSRQSRTWCGPEIQEAKRKWRDADDTYLSDISDSN